MITFLFVDSERVWRGGQDQLLTLLPGLIRRGHRVHLACHPGTLLEKRARECGVQVHPLLSWPVLVLTAFCGLFVTMRNLHPDIVVFNTPEPILPGTLASMLTSVKARIIFRRVNFPLRRNPITRLKYNWGIDCIIAISESIGHQLRTGGVAASRIRTVYEGMDLSLFKPRRHPIARGPGEPRIIGTVAHLSQEKGLAHLIEAAARIPGVRTRMRFVIVGEGRCRKDLEALVLQRELSPCFEFTGFQNNPSEFMKNFDIFVLPSLSEGLSSAILTAMASALPVIATDVGGIPELVASNENGVLVPPANPEALADAIERLAQDPELAFRMGQKGRRRMEERFTLERKILETEQVCVSLLQTKAAGSRTAYV